MPDLGKAVFTLYTNSKPFTSGLVKAESVAAATTSRISTSFGRLGQSMQSAASHTKKIGQSINNAGKNMRSMGQTSLKMGAVVGIGLGFAIRTGIKFDQVMSTVQAATQGSKKDFDRLRAAAILWGTKTQFSASEVAGGMLEMGKSGFSAKQTLAALPAVLNAATAAGEDLTTVSNIIVNTLTGLHMAASQTSIVADGLTFAANDTTASISDFGQALKYITPVAHGANMGFHQINAALIALAKTGIRGTMAGTAVRGMLTDMQAPSKIAAERMKELHLSFRDANGNMRPFSRNIDTLNSKLKGMKKGDADKFLRDLFGVQQIAAARQFLSVGGDGLRKFEMQSRKSNGAAKKFADTMRDNLGGDMKKFKGTAESAAIKLSDDLAPSMRKVVQYATQLIKKFNEMDPKTRKIISSGLALTAVFLTIAGVIGVVGGAVVSGIGMMVIAGAPLVGFIAGIISIVSSLVMAMRVWIAFSGGKLGALKAIFTRVFSPIMSILRLLGAAFTWVAEAIGTAITAIAAVLGIPVELVALLVVAVIAAVVLIIVYWDKIKAATIMVWTAIVATLKQAWTAMSSAVRAGATKVSTVFMTVFNAVKSWFMKWWPLLLFIATFGLAGLYRPVKYVLTQIYNAFVAGWNMVASATRSVWNKLTSVVSMAGSAIANAARAAGARISQWFTAAMRPVTALASSIWNSTKSVISSIGKSIVSIAKSIGSRAKSAFQAAMRPVVKIASQLWSMVVSAISATAAKVVAPARKIGVAIVKGIADGIKSAGHEVKDSLGKLANDGLSLVNKIYGINSPSKVFADVVGASIPEGIALGIGKKKKVMLDALTALMASARQEDLGAAIGTISATSAANTANLKGFFNVANAGLTAYTGRANAAEVASIKFLASGKNGGKIVSAYRAANLELNKLQRTLPTLEAGLKQQQDVVDGLSKSLDDLRNIQLGGTQAFSDERFKLEQQMNGLQLQQIDLKLNGADDDTAAVVDLQKALDALQLQAQKLDLRESLELDPLRRQWEATINPVKEVDFSSAITQFQNLSAQNITETNNLAALQSQYDSLTSAVEAYQAALQGAAQAATDISQSQAQSSANDTKRKNKQAQIDKAQNSLDALVKKGKGTTAAANNLRVDIKKYKAELAKIPKMAKGGIVSNPTLAMVGEGNDSEAITPLRWLEGQMETSAQRAASFVASQMQQRPATKDSAGRQVVIENIELNFHGDVDPFQATRDMRSAIIARMGTV